MQKNKLNWKILFLLYLITRIGIILVLQGSWGGTNMLCYTVDCKFWWNNARQVVESKNPYVVWRDAGGFETDISKRADNLPVFFLIISAFTWIWKDIWSVFLLFFVFDAINIYLIYKLTNNKLGVLMYIIAPTILRGLFFPEDELLVTFALASIYFFKNKRYTLSTISLVLWFNMDFYPILFFPLILMNLDTLKMKIRQSMVFLTALVISHIPYFPEWIMAYQYRIFHFALEGGGFGIWEILPSNTYYLPVILAAIGIFYILAYKNKFDLSAGYFIGSLIFLSLFPKFSIDHLIVLIPLFLVWTKYTKITMVFWIIVAAGVCLEFLGLPSIGLISEVHREIIRVLIIIGFYLMLLAIKNGNRKPK